MTWHEQMNRQLARGIIRYRGDRSAKWIEERTAELGHRVKRETIANFEQGRKKTFDIGDLIMVALALEVPPVMLLYPELAAGDTEYAPGVHAFQWVALRWFTGESPPYMLPESGLDWHVNAAPLEHLRTWRNLMRERVDAEDLLGRAYLNLEGQGRPLTPAEQGELVARVESLRATVYRIDKHIHRVESELERLGYTPPKMEDGEEESDGQDPTTAAD